MQKRPRQARLTALWLAVVLIVSGSASEASLRQQHFKRVIDGEPVEVFSVSENGVAPLAVWKSLPPESAYPTGGMSVPELANLNKASFAVNANFYREDRPGFQEPIGLVVRDSHLLAIPNPFYPAVGIFDSGMEWDFVRAEIWAEFKSKGKTRRERVCRLNAPASRTCASLWIAEPSQKTRQMILIQAGKGGPLLGKSAHRILSAKDDSQRSAWFFQPTQTTDSSLREVILETRLIGERLGDRWNKVREAVAGSHVFSGGTLRPSKQRSWMSSRQPRTAVGVDSSKRPFVVLFDGRREQSRGVSLKQAWDFARAELKALWMVNLDGGGSSTMIKDGQLLNKPSDGYPRSVAVGFGAVLSK